MGFHPLNLGLRFILELAALFSLGVWGKSLSPGFPGIVGMIAVPLAAAAAWGTFRTPEDRSASGRAPVAVPGWARLLLEAIFFIWAAWGLYQAGYPTAAAILAGTTLFHYALSYDRIAWLLRQR
ncbi:MAG: YrdB family protein [Anaerolineales bacterium]|jgi:hypothetical protein